MTAVRTRDGRRLHVVRQGAGRPTVVLEAGMGASHHMWAAVAPLVAERTSVVAYDRAGFGASPPAPGRRDLGALAADLVDLLDALDGPLVLVAHSWGGPVVRSAAAERSGRVAGLVLVDASDEGCDAYFAPGVDRQTRWGAAALPALARLGLLRAAVGRAARMLPAEAVAGLRADASLPSVRTHRAEAVGSIADLRRLRDHPLPPFAGPATAISGARASRLERRRRAALVAAHRERVDVPDGRHVVAERSGHMVPFTEPGLVADEVLRLVDRLR